MGLTPQQAEAARSSTSVAVTAGAGTGKTHMLAERFLYHVMHGGLSPIEIVAVTFTEKAAAELRARIRQKMHEMCPGEENALAELEASQISTIHSLAARICRDHYDIAGLPPNFSILDESEGAVWLAGKFDHALAHLPLKIFTKLPYSFLRTALLSLLDDPVSAEQALTCQKSDWIKMIDNVREESLASLKSEGLWTEALRVCCSFHGSDDDLMEENRKIVVDAMQALEQAYEAVNIRYHLETIEGINLRGGSAKKWPNGGLNEVKDSLKKLRKFIEEKIETATLEFSATDDELYELIAPLKEAFLLVKDYLFDQKKKEKILSFADLEEYALKILQNVKACEYYQQRWKAFLIDEFQDTNSVQAELLSLLTQSSCRTIVGDEKQAIYGFRRSDVTVFRRFRQEIVTSGGKDIVLSQSFRTHDNLIRSFNNIFSVVLSDYHQELLAHRIDAPHEGPHIIVRAVLNEDKSISKSLRERVEARQIADDIKNLLDSGVLIHDKASETLRPLRPGDVAVLSRTWDALNTFSDTLAGAGIPAVHFGGGNLLETREAKDAYALIKFLSDPSDDIALVTVLRSPFFAVSDRVLFNFAKTIPPHKSWWAQIEEEPGELLAASGILNKLLAARNTELPSRLLQIANRLTGYLAIISNLPQGVRREADWCAFIEFIEAQTKRGAGDLFGITHLLSKLLKAEVEIPRRPLEPGNAVSLMTIHAAKGLEWPVVIVPDLARKLPNDSKEIYFEPVAGVAFKIKDDNGEELEPALYKILRNRKREKESEEAKRVLYVALTRARDRVILSSTNPKGGGFDILLPGIIEANIDIYDIAYTSERAVLPTIPEPVPFAAPQAIQLDPVRFGLLEIPATALTDYAVCPERFRFKYVDGHPGLWDTTGEARRIGRLTHKAIEKNITDFNDLRRYDHRLATNHIEEALRLSGEWHGRECFGEFKDRVEAHEFRVRLETEGVLIRGVIDLLGSDFVLDFKTDREVEPAAHRFQLWAYAKAAQKKQAHIAYLRHGVVHTFSHQELKEIEDLAKKALGNIRRGVFEATPKESICSHCGFSEICQNRV